MSPSCGAKKSQQQKQFMKNITESSDSSVKQNYTQPTLIELGDLKSETLGNAVGSGDGTSAA